MASARKVYLGDAVYAEYDGYMIRLTVEYGVMVTEQIWLEPEVVQSLLDFVGALAKSVASAEVGEK
jgi:hypothetical protein